VSRTIPKKNKKTSSAYSYSSSASDNHCFGLLYLGFSFTAGFLRLAVFFYEFRIVKLTALLFVGIFLFLWHSHAI
jgi:hypothetical protein